MATQNEWMERGQRAVGAATDMATGLFRGLQNLGPRIQASQYKPIVEAFCAYTGLMAAQHGRLRRAEIDGFRNFLMQHRQNPVFGGFPMDELIDKFRNYAVRAFLEETAIFDTVLHPIARGSDEARLIVTGCLSIVYADGRCDENERVQMEQLATRLGVDTWRMMQELGVVLPSWSGASAPPPPPPPSPAHAAPPPPPPVYAAPPPPPPAYAAPPPPPPAHAAAPPPPARPAASGREPCSFCQGAGCVFCNNTGFKA
ncbi:MAG: TerB family tellurite resistance protein [Magnetococcales bacterium]|nr:TerB family tellurite resistance protein [Magnetococcales bacterium]